MKQSEIQLIFDYNFWANQLILGKAAELSHQQLMQPNASSWGSLHGTLVHLLDSENMWRNLCQNNLLLPLRLTETEPFPNLEAIVNYWKREENEWRAYLTGLQDSDLDSILRYEIPEGLRERPLWHCFWHVVNHGTQHRSEVAVMLTDFGHSPGDMDFTLFLNIRAGIE